MHYFVSFITEHDFLFDSEPKCWGWTIDILSPPLESVDGTCSSCPPPIDAYDAMSEFQPSFMEYFENTHATWQTAMFLYLDITMENYTPSHTSSRIERRSNRFLIAERPISALATSYFMRQN